MTHTQNTLGFKKSPADTRVVVAMSGGVDSSVVACMLKDQGYDVIGITLQLYEHTGVIEKKNACCAGQDIDDARSVADKMGFPHYVLDYESRFKQDVIDDFADSYMRGETPIPCVKCNQTVKFKDLLSTAKELGADCLATGHYIQRKVGTIKNELHRGYDTTKDQSYFLFSTTQEQLNFLRFPLGHMVKDDTRALAKQYNLRVADKPDSQDICFVPNGGYADLVAKLRPGAIENGNIVHMDGEVLGTHNGIIHYTIGQRRGIGIGGRKNDTTPLYVIALRPQTHEVVVGPKSALAKTKITLANVNWIADTPLTHTHMDISVKIRSVMQPVEASIVKQDDTVVVEFATPEFGVSAGQACVFYDGSRTLGGGWIVHPTSEHP